MVFGQITGRDSLDITAEEIAQLYKYRWKADLFFKGIKQPNIANHENISTRQNAPK